jgi:hypothetical protein
MCTRGTAFLASRPENSVDFTRLGTGGTATLEIAFTARFLCPLFHPHAVLSIVISKIAVPAVPAVTNPMISTVSSGQQLRFAVPSRP